MDPSLDMAMEEPLPARGHELPIQEQEQEAAQQEDQVIPDAPPADDAPMPVDESLVEIPVVDAAVKTDDSTVIEGSTIIEGTPSRKKGTEIPPEHRGAIYQRYLNGESMGNIVKVDYPARRPQGERNGLDADEASMRSSVEARRAEPHHPPSSKAQRIDGGSRGSCSCC
jgi:hypothetical protein